MRFWRIVTAGCLKIQKALQQGKGKRAAG